MVNEMKRKVFGCLITVVVVIVLFMGVSVWMADSFFNADDQEIKEGFSTELVDGLKSRYGITIPDGAKFIKGYNVIFREPAVLVLFEYPLSSHITESDLGEYVFDLLKLDDEMWYRGAGKDKFYVGDGFEGMGDRSLDWAITHLSEQFTAIEFSQEDGRLLIRINADSPHTAFP